jgi:hypothetical protein
MQISFQKKRGASSHVNSPKKNEHALSNEPVHTNVERTHRTQVTQRRPSSLSPVALSIPHCAAASLLWPIIHSSLSEDWSLVLVSASCLLLTLLFYSTYSLSIYRSCRVGFVIYLYPQTPDPFSPSSHAIPLIYGLIYFFVPQGTRST